jgi:hypothetical protein
MAQQGHVVDRVRARDHPAHQRVTRHGTVVRRDAQVLVHQRPQHGGLARRITGISPAVETNQGLETYTIAGERGSGVIGINGATAQLIQVGDLVIVFSCLSTVSERSPLHEPTVVHIDATGSSWGLGWAAVLSGEYGAEDRF